MRLEEPVRRENEHISELTDASGLALPMGYQKFI